MAQQVKVLGPHDLRTKSPLKAVLRHPPHTRHDTLCPHTHWHRHKISFKIFLIFKNLNNTLKIVPPRKKIKIISQHITVLKTKLPKTLRPCKTNRAHTQGSNPCHSSTGLWTARWQVLGCVAAGLAPECGTTARGCSRGQRLPPADTLYAAHWSWPHGSISPGQVERTAGYTGGGDGSKSHPHSAAKRLPEGWCGCVPNKCVFVTK